MTGNAHHYLDTHSIINPVGSVKKKSTRKRKKFRLPYSIQNFKADPETSWQVEKNMGSLFLEGSVGAVGGSGSNFNFSKLPCKNRSSDYIVNCKGETMDSRKKIDWVLEVILLFIFLGLMMVLSSITVLTP